jgi:hypothetical protein
MRRIATVALLVAGLAAGRAASKPAPKPPPGPGTAAQKQEALKALRQQLSALRQEQKLTIQALQVHFKALTQVERLTERQLREEREALLKQEKAALTLTTDPAQKRQIRTNYEALRDRLKFGVKLGEAEVRELRQQEQAMIASLKDLFGAQIRAVEAQIRAGSAARK